MSLVKASFDLWLYTCVERQRLRGTSGGLSNMACKKSGKKRKEETQTSADKKDLHSSESSDLGSEFVAENSSSDSRSKEKSQKRKENTASNLVSPPRIDFTGLPEEPKESPLKPQTQSHDANPENEEKKKKDQNAEDTNQYDLSQVEVIDVNAEDCIFDKRKLL